MTITSLPRTSDLARSASELVAPARQCLESHSHFHHHCQTIRVDFEGPQLVLSGRLPSFYLKQQAQEALRRFGVPIENRIEVISCQGRIENAVHNEP